MAQTEDGMSFADCKVETSTDGSDWTDISGFAASVAVSGGDRQSGETYTFDGDTPIIGGGKREPLEVTVRVVYTEGASDPFEIVRPVYEAKSDFYVRWSPKGGASSEFMFTSDAGIITNAPYPGGESGSGNLVMFEFTLKTPKVAKDAVA